MANFQPGPENPVVQMPKVAIKGFSGNIADVDSTGHLLTTGSGGGGGSTTIIAPLGSKLSAASVSVVIASDQSPVAVTGTVTATNPSVGTVGAAVPGSATAIGIKDGSGNLQDVSSANPLRIDPTGTTVQPVSGTVAVTQSTSPWVVSLTSTTITGTVAVTQSGTWTVQQGSAPWTQAGTLTHNNAAPTSNNLGVLPAVASTAAPTYTTGDQVLLSTDLAGNLRVAITGSVVANNNITEWASVTLGSPSNYGTSPGAVEVIGVNAFVTNTVPVTLTSTTITGTVAVTQSGSWTNTVTQATASSLNATVVGTGTFAVQAACTQTTSPWVVSLTSTTITGTVAVTESGTWTVRCQGNAGAAFDAATAASAPANAIQAGLVAATSYPTAVTNGQLVGAMSDKAGRAAVVLNAPRDLIGTAAVSGAASSGTSLIGAGASGVFNDIISLVMTNESSTATVVSVSDGTTTYKFALAGNGGAALNFPTPLPAASAATAWTCGNSATVTVDYVVIYAKNK